jgi:hypothetical protein
MNLYDFFVTPFMWDNISINIYEDLGKNSFPSLLIEGKNKQVLFLDEFTKNYFNYIIKSIYLNEEEYTEPVLEILIEKKIIVNKL